MEIVCVCLTKRDPLRSDPELRNRLEIYIYDDIYISYIIMDNLNVDY